MCQLYLQLNSAEQSRQALTLADHSPHYPIHPIQSSLTSLAIVGFAAAAGRWRQLLSIDISRPNGAQ